MQTQWKHGKNPDNAPASPVAGFWRQAPCRYPIPLVSRRCVCNSFTAYPRPKDAYVCFQCSYAVSQPPLKNMGVEDTTNKTCA